MKRLDFYWNSINSVSIVLLPLSGLFCLLSTIRRYLYKLGIFKSYKAPLPVIIIGNISVGGTGKTPLIIELVKQLQLLGKNPGVISRGYGGSATTWPQLVNEKSTAEKVGDEPQLIFQHTKCPLVVGPNRQHDIELLIKQFDCDVVLADDGMQHYALQRDVEIAVVDSQRYFGNGFCIPSGPLREKPSRLKQVDLVLINGGNDNQVSFSLQPLHCKAVGHNVQGNIKLDEFTGKSVHAVAGIGNPERFFNMLSAKGINVIPHAFADHYSYKVSDFMFNDDMPVLMTEKDAVKCLDFDLPNLWSVPVEIKISSLAQKKLNDIFNKLNYC